MMGCPLWRNEKALLICMFVNRFIQVATCQHSPGVAWWCISTVDKEFSPLKHLFIHSCFAKWWDSNSVSQHWSLQSRTLETLIQNLESSSCFHCHWYYVTPYMSGFCIYMITLCLLSEANMFASLWSAKQLQRLSNHVWPRCSAIFSPCIGKWMVFDYQH